MTGASAACAHTVAPVAAARTRPARPGRPASTRVRPSPSSIRNALTPPRGPGGRRGRARVRASGRLLGAGAANSTPGTASMGDRPAPDPPEPSMCTAVRIVVAAAEPERRLELRRAAVTAEWEVVGEAADANGAYLETVERRARFLVLDASAAGPRPEALVRRLRSTSPNALVVGVGEVAGVDASVAPDALDGLRDAMRDLLHASGDHQHA